jgi:hypothetical protein
VSVTLFLSECTEAVSRLTNSLAPKVSENLHRIILNRAELTDPRDRKRVFELAIFLALWPVFFAALVPTQYNSRFPLLIFCVAALLSEAAAAFLFFRTCAGPRDRLATWSRAEGRLTKWSVIGAAAAGTGMLAFLVAAVANAIGVL